MSIDIRFENFELKSNETHICDIVDLYRYILPAWLYTLTVTIYDENEDAPEGTVAWSKATPEYGFASIGILSRILDRPLKSQHRFILHEILHIAHRREYNFVWDRLLNPIQDRNEELHKFLIEDYRHRNEEFIEELTRAILSHGFCAP